MNNHEGQQWPQPHHQTVVIPKRKLNPFERAKKCQPQVNAISSGIFFK